MRKVSIKRLRAIDVGDSETFDSTQSKCTALALRAGIKLTTKKMIITDPVKVESSEVTRVTRTS